MEAPPAPKLRWRARARPRRWWRRWLMRTIARPDVVAPDGHRYAVQVVRRLWPGHSRVGDGAGELLFGDVVGGTVGGTVDLFTSRMVWSVRVLRKPTGLGLSSFMYGEELLDREKSIQRALEIARALAAGQRP